MDRRQQIVDTLHRIATAREQTAAIERSRARSEHADAEASAAALEAEHQGAEAKLLASGTLNAFERELLWAQRTWVQRERAASDARVAEAEAAMSDAEQHVVERHRDTKIREHVRDHVKTTARSERETKARKELDDIAGTRWTLREKE